jgi:nifR3 family TIM-barrel protein
MINWKTLPRPMLALAPMADMTDTPFCLMCKKFGNPVVFREMVSAEAIIRGNKKTWKMAEFDERERPIVLQIFGNDPAKMAEAARLIEERLHPDGIDINMGCPVRKIISNFDGASLIRDPDRAAAIVKAIKAAVTVPVSVKTRLGWNDKKDCLSFVRKTADAGVDLITIHARTREQGYAGKADWEAAGVARQTIPEVPFLVNGDIVDAAMAKLALEISGADGVMIGRGALGNPWVFEKNQLALTPPSPYEGEGRGEVQPSDRTAAVLEHARLQVAHYGEEAGLKKLRKHLPFYFKGEPQWKELRSKLVRVSTLDELENLLKATP